MRCRSDQGGPARADRRARSSPRRRSEPAPSAARVCRRPPGAFGSAAPPRPGAATATASRPLRSAADPGRPGQAGGRAAGARQGDGAHPALLCAGRRGDPVRHPVDHRRRLPGERAGGSAESVAYLTIVDNKPGQAAEKLFAGWMFASTPSLSALDHGVYDVRVWPARWRRDPRRPARAESLPSGRCASASRPRNSSRGSRWRRSSQVLGHELAVEQPEAALDQPRHEMDQRHLRGVALAAEHALAEERGTDRHPVQAADQPAVDAGIRRCGHVRGDAARRRAR